MKVNPSNQKRLTYHLQWNNNNIQFFNLFIVLFDKHNENMII